MKLSDTTSQSVVSAHVGAIRELLRDYRGNPKPLGSTTLLVQSTDRAIALHDIFGCEETGKVVSALEELHMGKYDYAALSRAIDRLDALQSEINRQ